MYCTHITVGQENQITNIITVYNIIHLYRVRFAKHHAHPICSFNYAFNENVDVFKSKFE